MALPTLLAVCARGPVYVCARPWAKDLLAGVPMAGFLPMTGKFATDRRTVARHRAQLGGAAKGLLLPDSLSSAAVFRLAGVVSAGYRDDGRSLLLKWPFQKPTQPMHAVQSWYHLGALAQQAWGDSAFPKDPPARLMLPITPDHARAAQTVIEKYKLDTERLILIAPTATGLHKGRVKVWPHYEALASRLINDGYRVVYCVPPAERDQAHANAPSAQALEPLGLGAYAALTRRARLVVCNDSGVSHLAAAAQACQLTLFGVTSAARTGPWSPDATCLGSDTTWPTLDAVVATIQTMLASPPLVRSGESSVSTGVPACATLAVAPDLA